MIFYPHSIVCELPGQIPCLTQERIQHWKNLLDQFHVPGRNSI